MGEQLDLAMRTRRAGLLTVSELVRTVRDALDANLGECWVVGEVSNARIALSGHFYFTLKDERSALNTVMFRSAFERVRFRVLDGMEVVVRGRVSVFEQRGALQLYADEIEPRGVGALQVAFEQLKRRLEAEGLFDAARKRALPFLPRTVGIVTARHGAGLRDMLRVMLDRFPNLHVVIRSARVQGAGAAAEIAAAIADLNRDGRAEVIIVGRGGGSLEDLWAFNEEAVARAIYRSRIPIVSAVGHEVDYTVSDFVADLRAPTPTAAAASVVPSKAELRERIDAAAAALMTVLRRELGGRRETIDDFAARLREPARRIADARRSLADAAGDLARALAAVRATRKSQVRELALRLRPPTATARELRYRVNGLGLRLANQARAAAAERRAGLTRLAARLDSLSPLRVLERGYAVVTDLRDGRAIADAAAVNVGDELNIRLRRGRLRARTTGRES